MINRQIPTLNILFDIDSVLADTNPIKDIEREYYIKKSGIIVAAEHEHYVFIGAPELIKWLLSKPYVKIAFFSSAAHSRNSEFVKKLLLMALGEELYMSVASNILIMSKENLTPAELTDMKTQYQTFHIHNAAFKKDICKVVESKDIENTIFVEDNIKFIFPGQEKNFLKSPVGRSDELEYLRELVERDVKYLARTLEDRYPRYNSIFFITGILDECLKHHERGDSVTDYLFNLHFQRNPNNLFSWGLRYLPDPEEFKNVFYSTGLACLKTVNPDIEFVTAEDYMSMTNTPSTLEEHTLLDELKTTTVRNNPW